MILRWSKSYTNSYTNYDCETISSDVFILIHVSDVRLISINERGTASINRYSTTSRVHKQQLRLNIYAKTTDNMQQPNAFLLAQTHDRTCMCMTCRRQTVSNNVTNFTALELNTRLYNRAPRETTTHLDALYATTIQTILDGYSFQQAVLRGGTTHQFGTWLAQNTTLSNAERARSAREMCEIVGVYEGWETIVTNLVNPLITHVDCRRWSINYFYRARNFKFCLDQQLLHSQSKERVADTPELFSQHKFNQLMEEFTRLDILGDVSHCRQQAKKISKKFAKAVDDLCDSIENM